MGHGALRRRDARATGSLATLRRRATGPLATLPPPMPDAPCPILVTRLRRSFFAGSPKKTFFGEPAKSSIDNRSNKTTSEWGTGHRGPGERETKEVLSFEFLA
ncbi:MAG: hypothetical protein F6J93_19465 [Oscillatoria sp. SIO1A7]|nr:hypothetical protein [Oscillatoria sp. SIO1A7]